MLDLMKIDIKKFGLRKQPLYFLVAYCAMGILAFMILYTLDGALVESAPVVIDVLLKPVFIIWEAILISNILIDEFKNKTMLMLYTYPINRKKLIFSKVALILLYSLGGILAGQVILNLAFYGINQVFPAVPYSLTINQVIMYFASSVMIILLGLIPMCVGLVQFSSVATLVTSIIIVIAGSSSGLGFDNLLSNVAVITVMGAIGVVAAIYSLVSLNKRDIVV